MPHPYAPDDPLLGDEITAEITGQVIDGKPDGICFVNYQSMLGLQTDDPKLEDEYLSFKAYCLFQDG